MSTEQYEPIPNALRPDPAWKPTPALEAEVAELLTHYPADKARAASLMVLHAIQEAHGWIPQESVMRPRLLEEDQPLFFFLRRPELRHRLSGGIRLRQFDSPQPNCLPAQIGRAHV